MFSSKGTKGVSTKKTFFANFIGHPKLLAEYLFSHLLEPRTDHFGIAFISCCTRNVSPVGESGMTRIYRERLVTDTIVRRGIYWTCLSRATVRRRRSRWIVSWQM